MPLGSKRRKLSDTCKERSSLEQMKVDVSRLEADKGKISSQLKLFAKE
jgi:hypothetical protein